MFLKNIIKITLKNLVEYKKMIKIFRKLKKI